MIPLIRGWANQSEVCWNANKTKREEHELLCVNENEAQIINMPKTEKAKTTFNVA